MAFDHLLLPSSSAKLGAMTAALCAFALLAAAWPVHAQQPAVKSGPGGGAKYKASPEVKAFLKKKWNPKSVTEDAKATSFTKLSGPPAGFVLPLYPGTVTGNQRTTGMGKFTDVIISTNDPPATVMSWYVSSLKSAGWSINQKMPRLGGSVGQIFGYKDGKTCRISTSRGTPPGCSVTVSLVENSK